MELLAFSINTANLILAFKLLAVGMISVFMVLFLVIYLGKALIYLVNKFAPEEEPKKATVPAPTAAINPKHRAAIEKAVSLLTGGHGTIQDIKKM